MSDLAATNCGLGCDRGGFSGAWILIILLLCCGNGNGLLGGGFGNGCGGNDGCNSVIWIILILCLCGGGF